MTNIEMNGIILIHKLDIYIWDPLCYINGHISPSFHIYAIYKVKVPLVPFLLRTYSEIFPELDIYNLLRSIFVQLSVLLILIILTSSHIFRFIKWVSFFIDNSTWNICIDSHVLHCVYFNSKNGSKNFETFCACSIFNITCLDINKPPHASIIIWIFCSIVFKDCWK